MGFLRNKLVLILAVLLISSISGGWILLKMYNKEKKEKQRHEWNYNAEVKKTTLYKTKDNLHAASVNAITLSNMEFKRQNKGLSERVKSQGIKIKRLEAVVITKTETNIDIKAEVFDSVRIEYTDTGSVRMVPLKCIEFNNEWASFDGCIESGIFDGQISVQDSLIQSFERIPKKFLGIIPYGTKGIEQDIVSINPYTKIKYAKYYELKRK